VGRVFLVDTARATVTDVVAVRTEGTSPDFSWSLDGRFLLVSGSGPTRHAALYLVNVSSGSTQLLYEDVALQAPGALGGRISATGAHYAFATQHDVRVGDTSGGPPRLLAAHDDPNRVGGTWRPAGWSSDERWVALTRASESDSEIAIVDTTTNAIRRLGVGTQVAWRPVRPMPAPELAAAAGASAFGGSTMLYTYDIGASRRSVLMSGGSLRIGALAWHPREDRLLYTAGQFGPPGDDVFTWRLGDPAATRAASSRKVVDAWWSFDGSEIYGLGIRQDALASAPGVANYEVFDLASGLIIATVCRGDPRAACP
jgi:dipeptidyl aminopeptidase/acylaminoacyl peptidase